MKKLIAILMSIMMIGSIAGCENQTADSAGVNNEEPALTKIRISEFRGINWASAYVADSLGYFKEEGLDPEFVIYKDGPIAFQGMHAGDSDFCLLSAEPVMRAYDEGMESYMILTNTNNRTYAFATNSDIKTVEELKGKTVFAGMPGSAPYSFVLSLLKGAGLSENDVNFVNMEYGAAVIALAEGQTDGIFFDIYNKKELEDAVPNVNILVDATDKAEHIKLYGSEYCETTIVTTTKKYAEENPETVQKFVNASSKALDWISKNSTEDVAEVLLPYFEGMDKQQIIDKFETVKTSFSETGEIHEEGYKTVEDFCLEQGLISKAIGFENIIPTKFIENALAGK